MKTRVRFAIALGAAIWAVPMTQAVAGVDVEAGDWKIDFSGNINAFYVNADCDHGPAAETAVTGGLACTGDNSTAVRNGLLPTAFVFTVSTRQDNIDISATIGLYPGINSSAAQGVNGAGLPAALQTPGIDARQEFLTFGDASWGKVKMGRDIGLFGQDAILDDMTLLGVGTAGGNPAPGNTSLGRIGLGYIYTDWLPQIIYTTPNFMGFTASAGAFTPLDDGAYTVHASPQWQAQAAYAWGDPKNDPVTGKVWVDLVTQQAKAPSSCSKTVTVCVPVNDAAGIPNSVHGTAVDAGVKVDVAGLEGVVYGYYGKGVGTTGLYILGVSAGGNERESDGGYVQLTYKIDRLKVGASWGISQLKLASDENVFIPNPLTGLSTGVYASDLVHWNESGVFGVYYSLTKSLTLVGEFIDTESRAWNANEAHEKDIALGGILFF
jgi:porin-like protein